MSIELYCHFRLNPASSPCTICSRVQLWPWSRFKIVLERNQRPSRDTKSFHDWKLILILLYKSELVLSSTVRKTKDNFLFPILFSVILVCTAVGCKGQETTTDDPFDSTPPNPYQPIKPFEGTVLLVCII